jgi:sugar lactone lactonase YvrE
MNLDQSAATGALYVLEGGLPPRQVLTGRMISNGLAWSPDHRTLYHTDSWTRRIDAFDYEPETAAISAPKALVEFPGGVFPDGMAMDAEGNLWVALWGGGAVVRIDTRTGRELARITLPVSQPSSCAFGGPALDALYITTAHEHLDASTRTRQPLAGGIFCAHPGVCGLPVTLFTGPPDLDHSSFYPGRAERS